MHPQSALHERARALASLESMAIDASASEAAGRDPLEPLLWGGAPDARVGFFGRDPGREEIRWGEPLIGPSGRLVREAVLSAVNGRPPADFEERRAAARHVFLCNRVPYKPLGNKGWPDAVVERFRPIMAEVLAEVWRGEHLITLGNEAFLWFGEPARAFWERADRYEASLTVDWPRRITLHPLPHPSPANARWHGKFPGMLAERLRGIGFGAVVAPAAGA